MGGMSLAQLGSPLDQYSGGSLAYPSRSVSGDLLSLFCGNGRRSLAVIEAYIDESAKTLVGRPVYAVSAFIGTRDQWSRFEDAWQPILELAGIDYYHGKDGKCDTLRRPMVSTIRSSGVRGFTNSVFQDEYAKAGKELKSTLGNHYAFLALNMALQIREWARRTGSGPVAYVLEDGQPNIEHVLRVIKTIVGDDAAAVACAGKREFVGLQAADFLAHHTAALDVGLAWIMQLLGDGPGQVMWGHLDPAGIDMASNGVQHLMRRHRHQKQQKKREAKAARTRALD